jgi:hypothetical protein
MLVRLLYASRAAAPLTEPVVEDILFQSRRNNVAQGITGMLCFERRFGGWTMAQVNIAKVNPTLLLKYAEKSEMNPYTISGRASMALLEELIATGSVASRGA